jgi:outer membrane protein TolC
MILAQKENTSAARENLNIAQQRYKTGLISDVEVREAQLALGQAESNYHQALYDYNVAIAALNRAVGK